MMESSCLSLMVRSKSINKAKTKEHINLSQNKLKIQSKISQKQERKEEKKQPIQYLILELAWSLNMEGGFFLFLRLTLFVGVSIYLISRVLYSFVMAMLRRRTFFGGWGGLERGFSGGPPMVEMIGFGVVGLGINNRGLWVLRSVYFKGKRGEVLAFQ